MFTRLPQWIKAAKNRDQIGKCLARLASRLDEAESVSGARFS
jgi:hypothetical protein